MFWDEQHWFPQGISWNDLKSNNTIRYPDIWEITYAMKYSFVLLLLRLTVECFIFLPIGCLFGMIKEPWWIRVKWHLNLYQTKKVQAGFYVLSDQPQLYDVTECWRNWPHHPLTNGIWWYYVIETAFYCSLIISSLLFDTRRADFIQMTFHHIITIVLLLLSFVMNLVRIGTLILFSHDIADIFLELGKLCRYAGWKTALTVFFTIFAVVWIITRLIYFPFFIIRSILFDAPPLMQADYQWQNLRQPPMIPRLFVAMLLCLMILHIYWTFIILKIAQKSLQSNRDINDIREESDDDISSSENSSSENIDAAGKNNVKGKKIE